jgi:hypothetical protein
MHNCAENCSLAINREAYIKQSMMGLTIFFKAMAWTNIFSVIPELTDHHRCSPKYFCIDLCKDSEFV